MRAYLSENASQILDGLLFGLGVLAVYLGAVLTAALIRSLGGAGSKGITFAGRYFTGWYDHLRGEDRTTVNVTLNMIVDNRLKFDTLVADRRIWYVWPNAYRVHMIRRAARRTTEDNPVLTFPITPEPQSRAGRILHRCNQLVHGRLASVSVVKDGRKQRVPLLRENDYKQVYGPLISLVSEKCNNDNAIDVALGRAMQEYTFVIALTYEQLSDRRARHLRAMVVWEETLKTLPQRECPKVDHEEHGTRYRTLQAIARQYQRTPGHFGIVKVWRPNGSRLPEPDMIGELARLSPVHAGK